MTDCLIDSKNTAYAAIKELEARIFVLKERIEKYKTSKTIKLNTFSDYHQEMFEYLLDIEDIILHQFVELKVEYLAVDLEIETLNGLKK